MALVDNMSRTMTLKQFMTEMFLHLSKLVIVLRPHCFM
jgi:hypothetical protein